LTETLEGAKRSFKSQYVLSGSGKPYGDVKTGGWTAEDKRKVVEILDRVTSIFTTQANPDRNIKAITIGNY
jgi:hypothetical protein